MMRFKNTTGIALPLMAILLAVIIILPLSCGKKDAGVIKIGVLLPLTGPIASGGKRVLNGIELAVDDFNDTSSVKVNLVVEDSQADPATGVSAFQNLIQIERVQVVIGDLTSGVTLAIAPIAERRKVVVLAPGASSPDVRNAGDYIFRNWVSDDFDAVAAASYLLDSLEKRQAAVLYIQNAYGVGLKNAFVSEFSNLGGHVVLTEAFEQGQTDFRTPIAKLRSTQFDAIYVAGQPKETGFLVKQLREFGMTLTIFTNASVEEADFRAIAGELSPGIFYTTPAFNLTDTTSYIRTFVERYEDKYKESPDIASAHGYDAARMILHCIADQGITSEQVKKCLYSLRNFPGVTGNISIDSHGDAVKSLLVKSLIRPDSAAVLQTYTPTVQNNDNTH